MPSKVSYKYFIDELKESIGIAMSHCGKIVDIGHSNINFFDIDSSDYKYFSSMLCSTSMHHLVSEATNVTANGRSLIATILCNDNSIIESCSVRSLELSNHEYISCKIIYSKPR